MTSSPIATGFKMRCPQCGKGKLLRGLLAVEPQCAVCGLDLSSVDPADGPAFFAITLVGTLIAFAAGYVEVAYAPPMWLHMMIWLPLTLGLSIYCLRLFKALLIAYQYKHRVQGLGE